MLRLSTFGGLSLRNAREVTTGAGSQRSRLALLAVLAVAGERGVTRDKLLALFWPDADQDRARGALKQAIYTLRRDLGNEDVVVGTGDIRLNRGVITADVQDFQDAVAAGDLRRAVAVYTGPFLDGVYLRSNAEFERWSSDERARLQAAYVDAVRALADGALQRQAWRESADWWTRLTRLDPLNSEFAEGGMRAALKAGDAGAARDFYRAHEAALRSELGAAPPPGLAAMLQQWSTTPPTVVASALASATPVMAPGPAQTLESESAAIPPRSRVSALTRVAAAAAVLALAVTALGMMVSRITMVEADEGGRVAVLPFRVESQDPGLQRMGIGVVDALSPLFSGEVGVAPSVHPASVLREWRESPRDYSVDEAVTLGKELAATEVVTGSIVALGKALTITAALYDVREGSRLASVSFTGPVDNLAGVVENLAARLLAARVGESPERLDYVTTSSPFALNEYLAGRVALRAGRYEDARLHFSRALDSDTTFALAALGLTEAGAWALWSGAERERRIITRTLALRQHLSARDRALFDALVGTPGKIRTAAREIGDWERAVTLLPDVATAWYEYGDRMFHVGALVGVQDPWKRAAAAFERTVQLDPAFAPPYAHLVQVHLAAGDLRRARANMDKVESAGTALKELEFIRWRYSLADPRAAPSRPFDGLTGQALERIVGTTQLDGLPIVHAENAVGELKRRDATADQQLVVDLAEYSLALNRGESARALAVLERIQSLEPIPAGKSTSFFSVDQLRVLSALFGGLPLDAVGSSAQTVTARARRAAPVGARARALRVGDLCAGGLWHAERGDEATAARMLSGLRAEEHFADSLLFFAADPRLCARLVDAALAVRSDPARSVARVRSADSAMAIGPASFGADFGNVLLATLYRRLGDPASALRCIRRRSYYWTSPGTLFLAEKLRLEADMARSIGDASGAARVARVHASLRGGTR